MKSRIGRIRDSIVNQILGINVRATTGAVHSFLEADEQHRSFLNESVTRAVRDVVIDAASTLHLSTQEELTYLRRRMVAQTEMLRRQLDDIQSVKEKLAALRSTAGYETGFTEVEPLVSVRIASYRKTEELIDVAIASVRKQSYERYEIVIVNDGPNDRTRRALGALRDPRIRYYELDERGSYPADQRSRWMVAGTPAANQAAALARGSWIAPLDDDDEFTPDHIGKLLELGRRERAELAYGALIQKNMINHTETLVWSDPPAISQFSFQGALYLRELGSVFEYSADAWMLDEPGDWNLIRRMSAAGVTMAATSDIVATMNMVPYTHKIDA
ncbi:glycosyltransferase family 2 protein [Cryobacterium serini]|uniref:Glycosyltransferase family 2 protein n=1 Tax=Cryobacterium serini TaxID=1259201 RepID=A0A4R9BKD9_9MICO|nr:glycosyltransferase family 2 protein [Cryobacterium serini]TFD86269.1 glycosyltransferase family 2 protein [Cryobacterium serini]